jgi:hypothetical protein
VFVEEKIIGTNCSITIYKMVNIFLSSIFKNCLKAGMITMKEIFAIQENKKIMNIEVLFVTNSSLSFWEDKIF